MKIDSTKMKKYELQNICLLYLIHMYITKILIIYMYEYLFFFYNKYILV